MSDSYPPIVDYGYTSLVVFPRPWSPFQGSI